MARHFDTPEERGAWIAAQRDARVTWVKIAAEMGLTVGRVRDLHARHLGWRSLEERMPNFCALSTRAANVVGAIIFRQGVEESDAEVDAAAAARVAKLSAREFKKLPNVGRLTLNEVGEWLRAHGHDWREP